MKSCSRRKLKAAKLKYSDIRELQVTLERFDEVLRGQQKATLLSKSDADLSIQSVQSTTSTHDCVESNSLIDDLDAAFVLDSSETEDFTLELQDDPVVVCGDVTCPGSIILEQGVQHFQFTDALGDVSQKCINMDAGNILVVESNSTCGDSAKQAHVLQCQSTDILKDHVSQEYIDGLQLDRIPIIFDGCVDLDQGAAQSESTDLYAVENIHSSQESATTPNEKGEITTDSDYGSDPDYICDGSSDESSSDDEVENNATQQDEPEVLRNSSSQGLFNSSDKNLSFLQKKLKKAKNVKHILQKNVTFTIEAVEDSESELDEDFSCNKSVIESSDDETEEDSLRPIPEATNNATWSDKVDLPDISGISEPPACSTQRLDETVTIEGTNFSPEVPVARKNPMPANIGIHARSLSAEAPSSCQETIGTDDDTQRDPNYSASVTISACPSNNGSRKDIINSVGDNSARISSKIIADLVEKYKNVQNPNYDNIKVQYVPLKEGEKRKRRTHLCIFCLQDHQQLKRHMERYHSNELLVDDMLKKSRENPGSREPMQELIYLGDYLYNVDASRNDGKLRVARETNHERSAEDFIPCEGCLGLFFNKDYVKHLRLCTGFVNNGSRGIKKRGRTFLTMCSSKAEDRLRFELLPNMRHDAVFRAIRYDDVIIEYGNDMCNHLRDTHDNNYIMTQLRRLGKLKLLLKLKKLENMFVRCNSKQILRAVEQMAGITEDRKLLKHPTVAQNMATLIKAVAVSHMVNCYERNLRVLGKTIKTFIKVFQQRYSKRLSKLAAKSQGRQKQKKELPLTEDLKKLLQYLKEKRVKYYNKLLQDEKDGVKEFDFESYKGLMQTTLTTLQVSNTRRPGDVERITLDNYKNIERLHEKPEVQMLGENVGSLTKQYALMAVRGKLGNEVKVLVSSELELCIDMIIKYRSKLNISPLNEYLFALPSTPNYQIRHLSAYTILCRFALACGAEKPENLRATRLRKNLATECLKLELNDAELTDLARYMGHHVNTHRVYYRQHMVQRDIPVFQKFLEIVEAFESDKKGLSAQASQPSQTPPQLQEAGMDNCQPEISSLQEESAVNSSDNSQTRKRQAETSLCTTTKRRCIRPSWTDQEKSIVKQTFPDYLSGEINTQPSIPAVRKMVDQNSSVFTGRTYAAVKIWIVQNRLRLRRQILN